MSNSNLSVSRNKSESSSSASSANDSVKTLDKADQADVTAFQSVMEKKKDSGSKNKGDKKESSKAKITLSDLFKKEATGPLTNKDKKDLTAINLNDDLKKDSAEKFGIKKYTREDETDSNLNCAFVAISQYSGQSVSNDIVVSSDIKEVFSKISNEIVAKMMATNNSLDAKQEISISFKNDVLPGTEAVILKDGKSLSVSFVTNVDMSAQLILQNSNDLQSLLSQKLKETEVVINVKQSSNTSADTGDGRSRNQYYSDQSKDDDQKK